jgi:hypothetical protein
MKNEIQVMQVNDILSIAKTFAESGMFSDAKAMAQAFVKIQAGQEIGIPPFAAMSGIHIIQGKPTLGAGLIASTVKGSGKYDYRVKEMNEIICSIDFFQGKDLIGNSTFTIEDAKKALTKNIDKFPKNMLFARAISNGVKWFCPDVFSGPVYVPGEIQEVTEDVVHVEIVNDVSTEKEKASFHAKATVQPPTKEWATTENLKNAKLKGFTIEDVKKKYKVRPDQETEFSNL